MLRKIDAMHHYYGIASGRCENCPHFVRKIWNRTYHKCSVYGDSNSEATDWRCGYQACGLIDKPFPEGDARIVKLLSRDRDEEPLPGQISMDDILGGDEHETLAGIPALLLGQAHETLSS